jgi:hypothetical protein
MGGRAQLSTDQLVALRNKVLEDAGAARANPRAFFSFVIKEETTRARVKCLPFQEVVFKFVEHFDRCVIRMPVGFSKTYTMAGLSLYLLGRDNTTRGVVVSASQGQAQKPVGMVRDYIEGSHELHLVFPKLRQSSREGDPWTQDKITVERPAGIRDPSLTAVGYQGKLPGSRLNWILVDDILTGENTNTPEQRNAVAKWFSSTVLSRRDIRGAKIVVTNTPWHPDDLTYRLEKAGWPTLTIDIDGNIFFTNTCAGDCLPGIAVPIEGEFDCEDIRPSEQDERAHRLTAHDSPEFDPDLEHLDDEARRVARAEYRDRYDVVPLWPERYGTREIAKLKRDYQSAMHEYYQLYKCVCRDDEGSRVKVAYIDACKEKARSRDIFTFASAWDPSMGRTFTGVDLGVGKKRRNDRTSIFTFAVLPDGYKRLLRLDSGRWDGGTIIDMVGEHFERYGSIIRVETNAAQDFLKQWALERNKRLPLRGMPTGRNKSSREHGVESIFIEIQNATWLIPNDHAGGVNEAVQRWIDAMLYYNADAHTGDELMASWLAREQARESGALRKDRSKQDANQRRFAAALSAR